MDNNFPRPRSRTDLLGRISGKAASVVGAFVSHLSKTSPASRSLSLETTKRRIFHADSDRGFTAILSRSGGEGIRGNPQRFRFPDALSRSEFFTVIAEKQSIYHSDKLKSRLSWTTDSINITVINPRVGCLGQPTR